MAGSYNPDVSVEALIDNWTRLAPAKFDAIDTEMGDGITTADVAKWYRAPLPDFDIYPSCVVQCRSLVLPDALRSSRIKGHDIEAVVYVEGIANESSTELLPQEELQVHLYRMVRGMIEVVEENRTLANAGGTDQVDNAIILDVALSDVVANERGFIRGARLGVFCHISP